MSCEQWEERIADETGGGFSDAVEGHLRACPACAALAEELESERLELAAPLDAAGVDYAAMRLGIRAAIVRERRVRRYGVGLAAAAALIIGLVLAHPGTRLDTRPAPPVEATAAAPVVAVRGIPAARVASHHVAKRRRARRAEIPTIDLALLREITGEDMPSDMGSESAVEMRIETGNPNVTIILLQAKEGSYE